MDEQVATPQDSFNQPNLRTHDRAMEQIRQSTVNQPNAHTHDMTVEQSRQFDWPAFNNQLPNMSTIRTPNEMSAGFPSNWHPSSSFQFLRPTGVLPFNMYVTPTNSTQNLSPALHQNVTNFQEPSHLKSFDSQHSKERNKRNQTGVAKEHWTVDEDVELCVAWLRISEDPIVGTSQRKNGFWNRVTSKFHELMKVKGQKDSSRTKDALQSRWGAIHPAVTRWSALHATLTRNLDSGWTVEQMESRVRAMYQVKFKELFKFEECWKILRDNYKWKIWSGEKDAVHEEGTQPVVEPMTQQDTINIDAESEVPLTPCTETPRSACPLSQLEKDKDKNPHISGPAARDMPRPRTNNKGKNQRQRMKQQFSEQQNQISDSINAALIGVDARAEERTRRQEELKRRRDEVLDQRFDEQKRLTLKEHEFTMECKQTEILKDLEYINDRIVKAYKDLEAMNQSSPMTPRERFEFDMKKEWLELLEAQCERKKSKLRLATSSVHSPEARPSTFRASTDILTPRRLDDEGWKHNLGEQ